MKLTMVLFFLAISQMMASEAYSQITKVSIHMKDAAVKEVLNKIEDKSEFVFLYNSKLVDVDRKVSVDYESQKIAEVLNDLFRETDVVFTVVDRQIVLANVTDLSNFQSLTTQKQKSISGKVTDAAGGTLPGVSVVVKGTTNGVITDAGGNYTLTNISEGAVVQFSFVGMTTQEIVVGAKSEYSIVLSDASIGVDEVIVIGYGTASRKDFTGSVSSVKMDKSPLAQMPNLNALESLKGNVAGLNIGVANSAGGQPAMDIRGQNSLNGSNDPLIVLDGIIYMGSLSDINPNDIETYDILKDAVSAAAYGSRSANGVIAITTKKGTLGKPMITFNMTSGVQTWQNKPVMMRGEEWISVVNARNQYTAGSTNWMKSGELANLAAGKETVWLDEATQTGVIQDYQVAVSGAAQNVNYYFSTSYNDNKGIVVGDTYNRISLLGKINTNITSWLKVGLDASYSKRDYSGFGANIGAAETMSPYGVEFRDAAGNLEKYPYTQSSVNPLWGVQDGTADNKDIRNNFRLNAYAVVDIPWIKGLNFKMNLLSNLDKNQSGNFYNENNFIKEGEGTARYEPATVVGFLSSANGNINMNTTSSYVFDNILNYKHTFGRHSVEATLVATRDFRRYEENNSTGSDFASNGNTTLGMWGLSKATVQKVNLFVEERANIGYLGRISYSFHDKYFVTSSYRRDGASVFGANKKWANFAALGGAWKITNEEFLKDFKPLNSLKLKLSWGQNGNQGIDPYQTLSTIANGNAGDVRYEFANSSIIKYGLFQNALGNSDLGWETTEAWNTGFESSWLNNRLSVDLDLYTSKTTDQIFVRNIPVMTGFKTIRTSMGEVDNKGIELTVRSTNIKTRDLVWNTSVTYWKNANKLVHLYGEDKNGDGKEDDDISSSLFIGKSLRAIYGYEQIGIVQATDAAYIALTGAAPGAPMYKDLDNVAGITAADRKILGYDKENFRLNMSNSVSYKNFELYAMITGTFGGNGYFLRSNTAAYMTSGTGRFNDNMTSKPYWTPENKSNEYPSAYFTGDGRYQALQSRGFVRVQDVSLSYTFNQPWIKAARINTLKVFISAKNLATVTNWFGGDPELGNGVRANVYPVPSTYSIGANISF
jgi:TonB-linked SusC/RagA family outer membrane protein